MIRALLILGIWSVALGFVVFQDAIVFERVVKGETPLENGENVLCVDSDDWKIVRSAFDLEEYLSKATFEFIGDPPKSPLRVVHRAPLIFEDAAAQKCYTRLSTGGWISFKCPEGFGQRKLVVKGEAEATFEVKGGWKPAYVFFDGILEFRAMIDSPVDVEGDMTLVYGKLHPHVVKAEYGLLRTAAKAAPSQEERTQEERWIYRVPGVKLEKGTNAVLVMKAKVSGVEEILSVIFPVSSSSGWENPRSTLSFENNTGLPLPDGEVLVFHAGELVGRYELRGGPVGARISIVRDLERDVKVRYSVLRASRLGDKRIRRIAKIEIENYSGRKAVVEIGIAGVNLELLDSSVKPFEVRSDEVIFKVEVKDKKTVTLQIESDW